MENVEKIYQLTKQLENCTHFKFIDKVTEERIHGDLGIIEENKFVSKYTSAVIDKTLLVDFE